VSFYTAFLVIFFIWAMGKGWTHRQHEKEQRTITKALESNTKVLEAIARHMQIPESEFKGIECEKLVTGEEAQKWWDKWRGKRLKS